MNLATRINSIARIMDQDVYKQPSLITGEPYPAGIFNCRQIFTGAVQNYIHTAGGVPVLAGDGNTGLPISSAERYPDLSGANAPRTVPCGSDKGAQVGEPNDLADIIRQSGLTGTVAGLPGVTDPAYGGIQYRGDQASVAGDITVNPLDVDVLLGDQPVGS